jgi:hypothetical protein
MTGLDYTGIAIFFVLGSIVVAFIALKVRGKERILRKGRSVSTVWLRLSQIIFPINSLLYMVWYLFPSAISALPLIGSSIAVFLVFTGGLTIFAYSMYLIDKYVY